MVAFAEVLQAAGPDPDQAGPLALFGRFAGAWDIEWRGVDQVGKPATMRGDLHFGWVLGGRAVLDVWRVPSSGAAPPGLRPFLGTTVRFYDQPWAPGDRPGSIPSPARSARVHPYRPVNEHRLDDQDDLAGRPSAGVSRDNTPEPAPESFQWTEEVLPWTAAGPGGWTRRC